MSLGPPFDQVIDALQLPPEARVGTRIPKKTLIEQTTFAAGDRRALTEGIDELTWIAKLAPSTVGIAAGGARNYLELQVMALRTKTGAKKVRVIELVHRAVNYPVLLVSADGPNAVVSAAHVRPSATDVAKTVVDEVHATDPFDLAAPDAVGRGFVASLGLAAIRPATLEALVDGWIDRVATLGACRVVGRWAPRVTQANPLVLRELHVRYLALAAESERLRHAAEREPQLNRRVDLNLARQRVEVDRKEVHARLEALTSAGGTDQ